MKRRRRRFAKWWFCFGIQRRETTTMPLDAAERLVWFVTAYAAAGLIFAALFVWRGVTRIDPLAPGSPWSFRLLILPGCAIFWPLLLVRWLSGSVAPPVELNAHRLRARRQQ